MAYNWMSLMGNFEFGDNSIVFKGERNRHNDQEVPMIGNAICDQFFAGGKISADIKFTDVVDSGCEIIVSYEPATRSFLSAGIGGVSGLDSPMLAVRTFSGLQWTLFDGAGGRPNMKSNKVYRLAVELLGSRLIVSTDGVVVMDTNVPSPVPRQVGLWCRGSSDIMISNYKVQVQIPTVFVVMQFTQPYDELYSEVIKPVCREFKLEAVRADETFDPGFIISDIVRQVDKSSIVIAEITPANPNVYYEVGYAHARNKPTILIADKNTEKLPFDVSACRVLMYENSIGGKTAVEEGLRGYIKAILSSAFVTRKS